MNMEEEIRELKQWKGTVENRFALLSKEIKENTDITKKTKEGNDKILLVLSSGDMVTSLIKWLVTVGGSITVILAFWHAK